MHVQLSGVSMMRIAILMATVFALAVSGAPAMATPASEEPGRPTAILVRPIHDAQVVRGDDGMEHVEYELLVVSVFAEPVTLSSVTVLGRRGKELTRIEGDALAAATQTLFAKTPSPVVPASAAVSVDVDLVLAPGTVPARVTHRIDYAFEEGSQGAVMIGDPVVEGPRVAIDRKPAIVIEPPLRGDGWFATTACCAPNVHRDLRIAIDGRRIETAETFAIDWARIRGDRIWDGDGSTNEQHYAYGADVHAVADGTVVAIQDGKPEGTPGVSSIPESQSDFAGNRAILKIAPRVFALYAHLQPGSLTVEVGDKVKAGAVLAKLGNTGPSEGPHLHFGISNRPDFFSGRSLPFVFDRFTVAGTVDLETSEGDHLVISPESRQVRAAYPLYGGIQNFSLRSSGGGKP